MSASELSEVSEVLKVFENESLVLSLNQLIRQRFYVANALAMANFERGRISKVDPCFMVF